jgi:hypothetical protein
MRIGDRVTLEEDLVSGLPSRLCVRRFGVVALHQHARDDNCSRDGKQPIMVTVGQLAHGMREANRVGLQSHIATLGASRVGNARQMVGDATVKAAALCCHD